MFETALNNPDIIESASGADWFYIKYSNGFVLQGANVTTNSGNPYFNFPVKMKDAGYSIATTFNWNTTGQNGVFAAAIAGKTPDGMGCQCIIEGRTGQTGVAFYGGVVSYIIFGEYAQ